MLNELLERARSATGKRVPVRGPETHKGRVGDAVERMLLGARHSGAGSDHPDAEIKSVPVFGERILERTKLGVISARSNPLEKCEQVLFVFVEDRGRDTFIAGHALYRFPRASWLALWRSGHLVETAAGASGIETRGLYLTPRFFYDHGLWPSSATGDRQQATGNGQRAMMERRARRAGRLLFLLASNWR